MLLNKSVSFRDVRPSDLLALTSLDTKLIRRQMKSGSTGFVLLADQVLGCSVYKLYKKHLQLEYIGVKFKRKGYGSLAINRLKDKLDNQNLEKIVTAVPEDNLAAHLFLKHNGFLAYEIKGNSYIFEYYR